MINENTVRPQFSATAPVVFGEGALSELAERVKSLGCKKVMVCFDAGTENAGIAGKVLDALANERVNCVAFNGVIADPTCAVVNEAGALAVNEGVDCIIGLGGGSSMDTAKAVAIYLHDPVPVEKYILPQPPFVDTKTPVILVPTTAGTGSESTRVAIISRPELNAKWSVFVNTTLAVIDPALTVTLPKDQTANTGLDAMAHAAEALTSNTWNHHSDLFAEAAIKKIAKYLYKAYCEPDNIEARTEMSLAANWAGFAFSDPLTHVGHAAADAFSGHFHTPHGLGCALALPEALAFVAPSVPERMRVIASAMEIPLTGGETGERLGKLVADWLRGLMRRMEMPSLKKLGYSRDQVTALAPDVAESHLSTHCTVNVTAEAAEKLLGRIYDTYN